MKYSKSIECVAIFTRVRYVNNYYMHIINNLFEAVSTKP